jgi:hypothetical protein
MQLANNADLASALAPGRSRYFRVVFKVDWLRDGAYADVNSDLSELVSEVDIDRQLTGNFPPELEVTEGYAAAEFHVTLEGNSPDGTPVWRLFSPYSARYPGTVAALNSPCYLDLVVATASGDVAVRQFTGYVYVGVPSRKDGTVVVTIRDAAALLAAPVDVPAWAADSEVPLGNYSFLPITDETTDSGRITVSSLMNSILRKSGFYQGPPWHSNVIAAWPLVGSALPEVGHFATQWWAPNVTPAGDQSTVYEDGKYGKAFKGSSRLGMWNGATRSVNFLAGRGHASQRVSPLSFGSNSSNLLGFSSWVKTGPLYTDPGNVASSTVFLLEEGQDDTYQGALYPAQVEIDLRHDTGALTVIVRNSGWTKTFQWTGNVTHTVNAWHFLFVALQFTPAGVTPYLMVDGASVTLTAGANPAQPPGATTLTWLTGNTNLVEIELRGPAQYAQWFYQYNTALGGLVWPTADPVNPRVQLDMSRLRLQWTPRLRQQYGWDLRRTLAAADLGALYVTELGTVTFDNRDTVRARQDVNAVTLTLSTDDVEEIRPESALEAVVNAWTYQLHTKFADSRTTVFAATQADQFPITAHFSRTQPYTLTDNVQALRIGAATSRLGAMGYQSNGVTAPGGAWRDWMEFFRPDYWNEGFVSYQPGSRSDPATQPVPVSGVNASTTLGWQDYTDQDPTHVRFSFFNSSAVTAEYAVDEATPFFKVSGTLIIDGGEQEMILTDAASVLSYGIRSRPIPSSDWLQDDLTVTALVQQLLGETAQPRPNFQSLDKIGDPRTQLQDVVRINDAEGVGGPIYASVVGIKRKISKTGGVHDSLTLRTFGAMGGVWIMDDPSFSVMDVTTIVS